MALRRSRPTDEHWMRGGQTPAAEHARHLPVNVDVHPDSVVVQTHLPGFTPDEIDVYAAERNLTISTNRPPESTPEQRITREVFRGNWYRRIRLPVAVQAGMSSVAYQNGELTICLPRVNAQRSILLTLPGGQTFERPEIPERTSADVAPLGPGPHAASPTDTFDSNTPGSNISIID